MHQSEQHRLWCIAGPGCIPGYSTGAIMLVPDHPSVPVGFDYQLPVLLALLWLKPTFISLSLMLVHTGLSWCPMSALVFIGVGIVGTQCPSVPCHFLIPAIWAALLRSDTPTLALLDHPLQLDISMTSSHRLFFQV